MVLEEEIGSAFEIQSVAWHWLPIEESFATCDGFELHMGYCTADELGDSFDDNYDAGTKTLVYSNSSLYVTPGSGDWTTIDLATPFWYNGSGNLIIEVEWDNGTEDNSYYCGEWNTGSTRCLKSEDGGPAVLDTWITHMLLTGDIGLDPSSFGYVKAFLIN